MEVQKLNHKILFVVGMCLRSDASQSKRVTSTAVNVVVVIFLIAFGIFPSVAYMHTHADNLQNCLLSAYQVVAFISCTGVYVTFAMQKAFVHNVFVDCARIAIQRKRWHNDLRYARTERKCYISALLPLTILPIIFVGNSVVASSQSIISGYLNGRWDPLKWYTPYKMTVMWERVTVPGYLFDLVTQIGAGVAYAIIVFSALQFFIGFHIYLECFCVDMQAMFNEIDDCFAGDSQPTARASELAHQRMIGVVKFHIDILRYIFIVAPITAIIQFRFLHFQRARLFDQIGKAISGTIFILLVCGAIFMGTAIFQLDLTFGSLDGNLANLFLMMLATSVGFLDVFLITFFATKASLQLSEIGDLAYRSLWYKYPTQLQKQVRFMIQNAQRPKLFIGFSVIICNLNAFTKLMNTAVSYFLMFKNLSSMQAIRIG